VDRRHAVSVDKGDCRRGSISVGKRSNQQTETTESATADASGRT
jgi:hypothetical protein